MMNDILKTTQPEKPHVWVVEGDAVAPALAHLEAAMPFLKRHRKIRTIDCAISHYRIEVATSDWKIQFVFNRHRPAKSFEVWVALFDKIDGCWREREFKHRSFEKAAERLNKMTDFFNI